MRGSLFYWLMVAAFSFGVTTALLGRALWFLVLRPWLRSL